MTEYKTTFLNAKNGGIILLIVISIFSIKIFGQGNIVRLWIYGILFTLLIIYSIFCIIRYTTTKIILNKDRICFKRIFSKPIIILKKDIKRIIEGYYYKTTLANMNPGRVKNPKKPDYLEKIGGNRKKSQNEKKLMEKYGINILSENQQIFIDSTLFRTAYDAIKKEIGKNYKIKTDPLILDKF